MPSLQIRNLPDDVYDALAERARRQRRSLAQQAIEDLSRIDELSRARRRLRTVEKVRGKRIADAGLTDPVDIIREDRER